MNEKINEIYEKFRGDNPSKDSKLYIETVESNIGLIERGTFDEYDQFFKTTILLSDYAICLVNDKQSEKSLPYFDKAIARILEDEKVNNKNLFSEPIYESLIFHRGIANYDLRKFIKAQLDFKKLIDNFPDNEKYRNWFNASRIYNQVRLEWILLALLGIFVVFSFIATEENGIWNEISIIGILFFLITSFILGRANKKLKKKVKYTPYTCSNYMRGGVVC